MILYVCSQKLLIGAKIDCNLKIIANNFQLFDDFCAFESLTKKGSCDMLKIFYRIEAWSNLK
jgi:hypothetical protein